MDDHKLKNFVRRTLDGADVRFKEIIHFLCERPDKGPGAWMARPWPLVVWLRRGRMRTFFPHGTRPPILREEGGVVYYPANQLKRSEVLSKGPLEIVAAVLSCESPARMDFLSFFDVPCKFDERTGGRLRRILARARKLGLAESEGIMTTLENRELALRMLRLIVAASRLRDDAALTGEGNRLADVMNHVAANFRGPVTIDALSRMACLSRPQFHRQFKALTGLAPFEFVKRLRLREVERLLTRTDRSVAEIGTAVGWDNQFHLSRLFKKAYGVSPLNYRKNKDLNSPFI